MLEMIPEEFHLQLWKEIKQIEPKLKALDEAKNNEKLLKIKERKEEIRASYDLAISKKKHLDSRERTKRR